MGTRADFYIGRGPQAQWVGSIAFDGYPEGIILYSELLEPQWEGGPLHHKREDWPSGEHLFEATNEETYLKRLQRFFQYRDDVSTPETGWPWPWETSSLTDEVYAFDDGIVWRAVGKRIWRKATDAISEEEWDEIEKMPKIPEDQWPNMKEVQRVTLGNRSGLLVVIR